jgi:hypothetical protein
MESQDVKQDDKIVAAILFGISFVIILKGSQLALTYLFLAFAAFSQYLIASISGGLGVLGAVGLVHKLFPDFFSEVRNSTKGRSIKK